MMMTKTMIGYYCNHRDYRGAKTSYVHLGHGHQKSDVVHYQRSYDVGRVRRYLSQ
jgi:hypothetical protein